MFKTFPIPPQFNHPRLPPPFFFLTVVSTVLGRRCLKATKEGETCQQVQLELRSLQVCLKGSLIAIEVCHCKKKAEDT